MEVAGCFQRTSARPVLPHSVGRFIVPQASPAPSIESTGLKRGTVYGSSGCFSTLCGCHICFTAQDRHVTKLNHKMWTTNRVLLPHGRETLQRQTPQMRSTSRVFLPHRRNTLQRKIHPKRKRVCAWDVETTQVCRPARCHLS